MLVVGGLHQRSLYESYFGPGADEGNAPVVSFATVLLDIFCNKSQSVEVTRSDFMSTAVFFDKGVSPQNPGAEVMILITFAFNHMVTML